MKKGWGRIQTSNGTQLEAIREEQCWRSAGRRFLDTEVQILSPVLPGTLVAVRRNYKAHAQERGKPVPTEPLLFLKAISTAQGPNQTVLLPPESQRVEYEGEIALVIGKRCRRLPPDPEMALGVVSGITAACDITARDIQDHDRLFTRGKGFDSFCPLGPWIVTPPPFPWTVQTRVNGEIRQNGNSTQWIFPLATILSSITAVMTLFPGDVILTGTPAGVGPLTAGDQVEVEVGGLPPLTLRVEKT